MTAIRVKICGLKTREAVLAAVDAGAAYLGFNFFPKSPRFVDVETARPLAVEVKPGVAKVGLLVDPTDAEFSKFVDNVPLDIIQLHGSEPPARVAELRARSGLPVIKAIGLAEKADLEKIEYYGQVADQLLVEPPAGELPGGNGVPFDWRLVANVKWPVPWMLAGGLTAENVAQAIAMTGANQVDVSSGVERPRGEKNADLIREFIAAAR